MANTAVALLNTAPAGIIQPLKASDNYFMMSRRQNRSVDFPVDDIELARPLYAQRSETQTDQLFGALVIQLDAKLKTAAKVLHDINMLLVASTTEMILQHKPIFDEQKRHLIVLQGSVQKLYYLGTVERGAPKQRKKNDSNCVLPPMPNLNTATFFAPWNCVATDINTLLFKIENGLKLQETSWTLMRSMLSVRSDSSVTGRSGQSGFSTCSFLLRLAVLFVLIFALVVIVFIFNKLKYTDPNNE